MAIQDPHPACLKLRHAVADRDQVGVHQLNQRAPQQKIEPDESHQRGRIIEHASRGFFHLPSLLNEIRLQDFPQAPEAAQGLNHFL